MMRELRDFVNNYGFFIMITIMKNFGDPYYHHDYKNAQSHYFDYLVA